VHGDCVGIRSKNGTMFLNLCEHNWWGRSRLEGCSREAVSQVDAQPPVARTEEGDNELGMAEDDR
jgi:hypothetical protein